MRHSRAQLARFLTLLVAAALTVTACGGGSGGGNASGGSLGAVNLSGTSFKVGSKEFTEQLILGQIAAQALRATGANAGDPTSITGSSNVRTALTSGAIDMYWEYTGTGWTTDLQHTASEAPKGSEPLYQAVAMEDLQKNQIKWLQPAPLNDTYAIATAHGRGQQLGVSTLSDYAKLANTDPAKASFCGATEFLTRDDGWPGVQQAYGFSLPPGNLAEVDPGLVYTKVPTGDPCNFGEVFATDGRILANNLDIIPDDKEFFVKYNVAMTMRQDVFAKNPTLADVFNPISAKLTNDVMLDLSQRVTIKGELSEDVAKDFLQKNGFLG